MSNPLNNELLGNPLSSSANAGQYEAGDTISTIHGDMEVTGVDELGRPQVDQYGGDLNWEDSFGPASKHLGVSEGEWQEFISGVNEIKAEMRQYEGNEARVMQQRSQGEDAVAERRIGVLMNTQGLTREEAESEVYSSEQYTQSNAQFEQYNDLNQQLNDLYASVGLDSTGAIQGSGTNSPGYAVNFDLVSGDVSHSKGDAIHSMGKMAVMAAAGVVAGPAVAGALGGVLGPAAAKAASSAIINLATQYMSTGEVDLKQALISAATSYGGAKLGDALKGSSALSGIGDKVSSVTDKFNEVLDKTGSIGSAAIKAGGMSMLTQMVTTGEIDVKQAGLAALMAAGSTGLSEWQTSMEAAGIAPDEYMQDLAEYEEFQQAAIDADLKDPFLNPNYKTVGDGVIVHIDTGEVFGYGSDKSLGTLDDLDSDGDGMLSGTDLQEVDVPERDLVDPNINDNVYGDVDLAPPDSTTNPTAFTEEWANERYGALSESQTIAVMQRDGFTDDQIDAYLDGRYDDIDALNPNIVTHAGGWVENMEQPYTLEARNGNYYILQDGKLKAISAEQYEELGYYLQDPAATQLEHVGDAYPNGMTAEQYMQEQGITSGGEVFGGYDEYGRPIYNQSETVDDWITLDGSQPPVSAPIDDFVDAEPEPVEPEPVEPVETTEQDTTDNQTTSNVPTGGASGSESPSGNAGTPGSTTDGVTDYVPDIPSGTPDTNKVTPTDEVEEDLNNPLTGGPVVDDPTDVTEDVDPSNGTGTPVQTTNAQIEALMDRGMTYEQAVANQNAAISAGADANGDGMVTNAEWSAHTGQTGAGETISEEEGSGNDVVGDNSNAGANDGDDLDPDGDPANTGGTTGGDDTGSNTTEGPGTTDDPKPGGGGPGPGPGTGPGGGPGGGPGMLGGGGFSEYTPQWGELFAYTTITPYQAKQLEPVRQHIAKARGMLS